MPGLIQHKQKCKDGELADNNIKSTLVENKELNNNNAIWGNHSIDDLKEIISTIYEEAVEWKRNLFLLPSGKGGKYNTDECF